MGDVAVENMCGRRMVRAKAPCARKSLHQGEHRTREALVDRRARKTARRVGGGIDLQAKARWARKSRLSRYKLTQEEFDRILEVQGQSCGMCWRPFEEAEPTFIDHDHRCCPDEKRSCGQCIRGLLCLSCNTALGQIERKLRLAQIYQANPPGKFRSAA